MPALSAAPVATNIMIDMERPVRFTWASVCRFEEKYGKSIPDSLSANLGTRLITHLVWAGLLHNESDLKMSTVEARLGAYVDRGGSIGELAKLVLQSLVDSGVIGRSEDKEGNEVADSEGEVPGNAPPQND